MTKYILKMVFAIFKKENVKIVIHYGNKQGRDIDVFVIITGKSEYGRIQQDRLDITYVGEKWLGKMIQNLDPLLTEPVLMGRAIYGDVNDIKVKLNKIYPSDNVINYLNNKALLYIQWASTHLQNRDLVYACDCIRFSLSFYYFAMYYHNGGKIITFSDLLNKFKNERILIEKVTKMAKNKEKITFNNVESALIEAHIILTKNLKQLLCK